MLVLKFVIVGLVFGLSGWALEKVAGVTNPKVYFFLGSDCSTIAIAFIK